MAGHIVATTAGAQAWHRWVTLNDWPADQIRTTALHRRHLPRRKTAAYRIIDHAEVARLRVRVHRPFRRLALEHDRQRQIEAAVAKVRFEPLDPFLLGVSAFTRPVQFLDLEI